MARSSNRISHRILVGVAATPVAFAGIVGLASAASAAETPTTSSTPAAATPSESTTATPDHRKPPNPPTTPPTTTPSDPPAEAVCPTDGSDLTNISYTVNGKPVTDLYGNVASGNKVTATFTVADGCSDQLSLVAYTAPSGAYVASETSAQKVYGTPQTGTFGPGEHTLSVTVPACYFQVDFVRGAPIYNLTPDAYTNAGHKISAANGGTISCDPVKPPVPPKKPTKVLALTVTKAPATPVVATSASLPFTGSNTPVMLETAGGLLGLGIGMTLFARRRKAGASA